MIRSTLLGTALLALLAPASHGQTIDPLEQTLHGFCGTSFADSTCSDTGSITPTETLGTFGFRRTPDNNNKLDSAVIWLVFLIPDIESGLNFTASRTDGAQNQTLTSWGNWSSGDFDSFLGIDQAGGPTNPIGAWLPITQQYYAPNVVTGYDVYQANFGLVDFEQAPDPTFTTSLSPIPVGTVVFAYLMDTAGANAGKITDSTANSGALIVTGEVRDPNEVPEPTSVLLLGTVLGLVHLYRRGVIARCE